MFGINLSKKGLPFQIRIINLILEDLENENGLIDSIRSFATKPSLDNKFFDNSKAGRYEDNLGIMKDVYIDRDYNIPLWELLRTIEKFVNPIKESKETADRYISNLKTYSAFAEGFLEAKKIVSGDE